MDLAATYEEFFPKIYNFFFFKVMHKQITEDLTSMVFLKVTEKLHTYNPDKGSISTWLFAIAQNILNDYFRTRHIPVSLDEATGDLAVSVDFDEQSTLIKDETRRELYMALSELDPRTRDVIAKKYFAGKTMREIAKEKGLTEVNASAIHQRGLKQLRKTMGEFVL